MNSDINKIEKLYSENPVSVKRAFEIQRELARKVIDTNCFNDVKTVAGVDLAIVSKRSKMICGIIVFSYPDLKEIERVWIETDEKFPYIPGLLAFREGPSIIKAYKKLKNRPNILIIDGHGIAHPRRFGIACHVGVLLDMPTFGVAKKRLYGKYDEVGLVRGCYSYIKDEKSDDDIIGVVIRTRDKVKPIFISIGNKINLETAIDITFNCSPLYRVPIPTREADKYVAEIKREISL